VIKVVTSKLLLCWETSNHMFLHDTGLMVFGGKAGFASLAHVCLHNIMSCLKVFGDGRSTSYVVMKNIINCVSMQGVSIERKQS